VVFTNFKLVYGFLSENPSNTISFTNEIFSLNSNQSSQMAPVARWVVNQKTSL
jgi:hypothetical protein